MASRFYLSLDRVRSKRSAQSPTGGPQKNSLTGNYMGDMEFLASCCIVGRVGGTRPAHRRRTPGHAQRERIRCPESGTKKRCPAFSGFPNDRLSPTGSGLNAHSDGYPRGVSRLPRGIIPVPLFTRMPDGVAPRRCVHTVSASRIFSSCRTDFVRTTLIIDHAGAPVKHRNPYFFSECENTSRNGLDKKIGPCYTESNGSFKCFRCRPGSGRG